MLYDPQLIKVMKQIARQAVAESQRQTRLPGTLTGTVEDLDGDLDVIYVRMDQEAMQSDPTVSDNYDAPGIIPVTRLGETFVDEQVRISFDATSATADGMRTGVENKIVLPFGQEGGRRIILDGNTGAIGFFDDQDQLVGFLDETQWFVGVPGSAIARLDPLGGLRLWDQNNELRVAIGSDEGIQIRDGASGITAINLTSDGITVADPSSGETVSIVSGTGSSVPTPHWAGSFTVNPNTIHATPAVASFETGDDLDLRFVAASHMGATLGVQTYTPPSTYTELVDMVSTGTIDLTTSVAYKDPALASPLTGNFVNTSTDWQRRTGHSVIVRGGGTTSPSVAATSTTPIGTSISKTFQMVINVPASVTDGHLLLAHVCVASKAVPAGWTVPEGWRQLGLQGSGLGTTQVLASGVWVRPWVAGDPMSETISINMTAAEYTRYQGSVVAVADPYRYPVGLDIRRNNRSMPRGQVAKAAETTDTATWANTDLPQTFCLISDAELSAGRNYHVAFECPSAVFAALSTTCQWRLAIQQDTGSGFTDVYVVARRRMSAAGTEELPVSGGFTYTPDSNGTSDWRMRLTNVTSGSGYSIQFLSSESAPRQLTINDTGAEY